MNEGGIRPWRRDGLLVRGNGPDTAVYDPETGGLHALNATAAALWELCDGETSIDEMVGAIVELTSRPEEEVLQQTLETLGVFLRRGLLEGDLPL